MPYPHQLWRRTSEISQELVSVFLCTLPSDCDDRVNDRAQNVVTDDSIKFTVESLLSTGGRYLSSPIYFGDAGANPQKCVEKPSSAIQHLTRILLMIIHALNSVPDDEGFTSNANVNGPIVSTSMLPMSEDLLDGIDQT
ncbi:hypothetical protein H0H93_012866, partial [Arthromyces matolae]